MKIIFLLLLITYLYLLLFSTWKTQVQRESSRLANALWKWIMQLVEGKSANKKPDPTKPSDTSDQNKEPNPSDKKPKDKDKPNPKPVVKGYDPNFTSNGLFQIRMETLLRNHSDVLAPLLAPEKANYHLLHYTHFSVAMHKDRRMPLLTAVNIDGAQLVNIDRETDKWSLDSRMSEQYQLPKKVYENNNLDLGHLVRRLDPVWGPQSVAEAANDETFHLTVCAPQHKNLNRKTWLQLEDFILKNTDVADAKVSVFTGPIFSERDKVYRGALLPLQFWKMVAVIKKNGEPSVTAYLLSHEEDLRDLKTIADKPKIISDEGFGAYKTYQIPLERLQELTGLNLREVIPYDPLKNRRKTFGFVQEHAEVDAPKDLVI